MFNRSLLMIEFTAKLDNTIQLNDDIKEQARRRADLLNSTLDVATKVSDSRSVIIAGIRDAKEMLRQMESTSPASPQDIFKRQDNLQVCKC